ncbi:C40 family peptidase [Halpernia frigidisoli]|uniref:SH3 domain-containing protein n=1 Tax=Halpernia frigidisoli TaxID=1125876 RepID=A0A1I3HZA8_9FLAO|nr:C40 family peptidase [Halpernia frigidisoli]SFI41031.1 SH3 domain-containing protein [Halpernia frigidisoli]
MEKAICNVSVAPVRADSSDKAEIVTQLLFGESLSVIEVKNNWTKIKMDFDGYEGWMDTKQYSVVSDEYLQNRRTNLVTENFQSHILKDGKILLSIGSEVDFETISTQRSENLRQNIITTAKEFLNVPYLWGGKSFFGIDCSGFTQLVYKVNGKKIPRDTYQQGDLGKVLDFVEESQAGDLAFFENSEGKIIHVGIMLNSHQIIHAHGKVRIDELDSTGIFNKEKNTHTHKLRFVKNLL